MLPDMSAKVSFLLRTLAPEEMKPRRRSVRPDRPKRRDSRVSPGGQPGSGDAGPDCGNVRLYGRDSPPSPFTENPAWGLEAGGKGSPVYSSKQTTKLLP